MNHQYRIPARLPSSVHCAGSRSASSQSLPGGDIVCARVKILSCLLALITLTLPALSFAEEEQPWEFGAAIYGWFPDLSGQTSFPYGSGGDFTIPIGDILDNLEFTLQGAFDVRKGNWGFFTDAVYMDIGASKSGFREGTIGGSQIPVGASADVKLDMQSLIWTATGYYRVVSQPKYSFDLLAGFRYMKVEQTLDWSFSGNVNDIPVPGRQGNATVDPDFWDAIVGLRGRYSFGRNNAWFLPYYLDVGTGDSDLTWQAAAGAGYAFNWGEVIGVWRYLKYDMPSGRPIEEIDYSGPALGVAFHW